MLGENEAFQRETSEARVPEISRWRWMLSALCLASVAAVAQVDTTALGTLGASAPSALAGAALSPAVAAPAPAGPDQDIDVRVQKNGAELIVDVDCPVNASLSVVWDVLTDYDHMADFLSDVQSSSVQTRKGAILHVYQKGKAARGLLTITFENLREVELIPYREIRSQLISGDLKASNFVTRVVDDGTQMRIVHSGRYTPKLWVPPVIGPALIEAETRKHFGELRAEVVRRNKSIKASSPSRPGSVVADPGTLASEAPR